MEQIKSKLAECEAAIKATNAEIDAEREDLKAPNLTRLVRVCKMERLLRLRKHLGEIKDFRKELLTQLKKYETN